MTEHWQKITITNRDEFWHWLSDNHQSQDSYLLVTFKKSDPERYVSRDEVLDALLAFGWIDGRRYQLDETRTMQLICQRKQQKWTKSYRDRIAALQSSGRLQPAGLAAVTLAQKNGTWLVDQDIDNLQEPDDLLTALTAEQGLDWWQKAAPSYRRNALRWLGSAKKEDTRLKRLHQLASACAASHKIKNL